MSEINPYAPTTKTASANALLEMRSSRGTYQRTGTGLLYRRIEAKDEPANVLVYDAKYFLQQIWVNERRVFKCFTWIWFRPSIRFFVETDGGIREQWEVRVKFGRRLRFQQFQVIVNSEVIFSEVDGKLDLISH